MYLTLTLAMPAGLPPARRLRQSRSDELRQGGFVVGPGVHVGRYGTGDRHLGDGIAGASSSFQTPLSPCSDASSPNRERVNANGWPRPSAYRQTASSASPRLASSAWTDAGETPGWSP